MKTILMVAALVVVAVGVWLAVAFMDGGVPVEVAAVAEGPISEFVDERGKTRLPRTYLVTMPYNGRIEAIETEVGAVVSRGQPLARVVPRDLQLEVAAAGAAVKRLDASIAENEDTSIENTALEQALSYVQSMDLTVAAAGKRVESGSARFNFAKSMYDRKKKLYDNTQNREQPLITREELESAEVRLVESDVDYQQDKLVHSALEAMQAATALVPTLVRQYISRKTLQRAVLTEERAEAQAALQQVQQKQERGVMASPVDGVVLDRAVVNERFLSAGTTLLEVGRLEDLQVETDVLSQDVVRVEVGDRAEVYGPAVGAQPARGVVRQVYPAGFTKVSSLGVEQQRVIVVVELEPQELARLRSERKIGVGYRVRVKIFTDEESSAAQIPRSALFRSAAGGWQVFAVRDGRARLQDVEVGLMNDETVEVASGLRVGEQVILAPETTLTDGDRVSPIETSASGE